ncbi:hypothetical protein Rsub_02157 [Raphidocelis subcapitata]|uniref:Uncharacterized protein n=1 Tax=Raphidocelis subcapitata TaxID=307507 RepID=A0A2V0NUN2_9CHLO|nr:hypothetical protein Rsub_02157 [Raphidocelis subcapitata]|eukprot:GBF89280.1 hypothetical protein Rsub_02157 [Raphidocelis subcapitata]
MVAPGKGSSGGAPKAADEVEAEDMTDRILQPAWSKLKSELKKELPPDQAKLVDDMSLSEVLDGDSLMRSIAESQLGPLLQSMGSSEEPFAFFIDLVKIACALQLASAGLLFYGCQLGLHLDTGDSLRAVAGLGLGYFARIFIPIEQLVWPVYNDLLQLISPNAVYEAGYAGPEERSKTLNSLGVAVAAAFLFPRYLLGWDTGDTLQIVLPMLGGLFLFDMAYLAALLYKLNGLGGGGGGGGE